LQQGSVTAPVPWPQSNMDRKPAIKRIFALADDDMAIRLDPSHTLGNVPAIEGRLEKTAASVS
jgi:hypothetical protein